MGEVKEGIDYGDLRWWWSIGFSAIFGKSRIKGEITPGRGRPIYISTQ